MDLVIACYFCLRHFFQEFSLPNTPTESTQMVQRASLLPCFHTTAATLHHLALQNIIFHRPWQPWKALIHVLCILFPYTKEKAMVHLPWLKSTWPVVSIFVWWLEDSTFPSCVWKGLYSREPAVRFRGGYLDMDTMFDHICLGFTKLYMKYQWIYTKKHVYHIYTYLYACESW